MPTLAQNRRAKLKRDLEEQRRDIQTAELFNLQKTFLESFQAFSQIAKWHLQYKDSLRTYRLPIQEELIYQIGWDLSLCRIAVNLFNLGSYDFTHNVYIYGPKKGR